MTIQVESVNDQVSEEDEGQVAPVEVADGDGSLGQELGQGGEPTAVLGHRQRPRLPGFSKFGH